VTRDKAIEIIDDTVDLWYDTLDGDTEQADVDRVEELLDLSVESFDREDWTGAWLWAGNALAYIRERLTPLPATA
jgi:hypothetical protein